MGSHGRGAAITLAVLTLFLLGAACTQPPTPSPTPEPPTAVPIAPTAGSLLFVTVDIVQGSKNLPPDQVEARACVNASRFSRNAEIVWRARIFDPRTGGMMDDKAIARAIVNLANGTVVPMKYGPHPATPPNEYFWTGSWVIPRTAPTGTLGWTVAVTSVDGRRGEYKPLNVAPSRLTILDEVLPDVGTPAPTKPGS